jgi:putative RNA 2'-phosphotransferase
MNERRKTTLSKCLSKYLRHSPEDLGITLRPGGWVPVEELLHALDVKKGVYIATDELDEIVRTCPKQRFGYDPTYTLIRANQGHTAEVELTFEEREPPEFLYHGTPHRFVGEIKNSGGLKKMARHHVHLSADIPTAMKVGSRRGSPVVLKVEAARMYRDGRKFYISPNGVWLVDEVPVEYIEHRMENFHVPGAT